MRNTIFFILIFLTGLGQLGAQYAWSDQFINGNFTTNPEWKGDSSDFIVNTQQQLQLQAAAAGQSYLVTRSRVSKAATWSFFIRMDFNPSASNFATVHLIMDGDNPAQPHQGYFLRFGGTTERRIHFFRRDGQQQVEIGSSHVNLVNSPTVVFRMRVTRNAQGLFDIQADSAALGNYQSLFQVIDTTYLESEWFGIRCHYTITRADKFFFDDFDVFGQGFTDTIAPKMIAVNLLDSTHIAIQFDKPMALPDKQRFLLFPGNQLPDSIWHEAGDLRMLNVNFRPGLIPATQYQLALTGLPDVRGNRLRDTIVNLLYFRAQHQSIVFNEIMADPDPPVKLPNAEYIELLNRTPFPISLAGWTLEIGNMHRTFGSESIIRPNGYLIVTRHQDTSLFKPYGAVAGLSISATALANAGQTLVLRDAQGHEIDRVRYSDQWYRDAVKRQGGWALERIDAARLCGDALNWQASAAKVGGTPGQKNSIARKNPDKTPPKIVASSLPDPSTIKLDFDEALAPTSTAIGHFQWTPALVPDSLWFADEERHHLMMTFHQPMIPGVKYRLVIQSSLTDCTGIGIRPDTLFFGVAEFPEVGDVILNEVLFQPPNGGVRFVELRNISKKVINLSQLRLGQYQNQMGASDYRQVVPEARLLFPGDYVVLTPDPAQLLVQHPQAKGKYLLSAGLTGMTNSGGSLALANASLELMDWLVFDNSMHHPLLRDQRAVSLERIRSGGRPNDPTNWGSAAAASGYATPGAENSNHAAPTITGRRFSLQDNPFYPTGDGFRDRVRLVYELEQSGFVANMRVYDLNGREVAHPVNQTTLGTRGELTWAGTLSNGQRAATGSYVLLVEVVHPGGGHYTFKAVCTLGAGGL
jgi:hypothetical protein